MPMNLTRIKNENEFYSNHYLSSVLKDDLKGFFKAWEEEKKAKNGSSTFHVDSMIRSIRAPIR